MRSGSPPASSTHRQTPSTPSSIRNSGGLRSPRRGFGLRRPARPCAAPLRAEARSAPLHVASRTPNAQRTWSGARRQCWKLTRPRFAEAQAPAFAATPRRPLAHGYRPLRAVCPTRASRHRRSLAAQPQLDGRRHQGRLTTSRTRSSMTTPAGPHQTTAREWGYGMTYRSSRHRARALPHWLKHYNTHRPHSAIGNQPPISRVHNLRGQDT
jgi:hypothetical protein